jgi:hypothetical protein
MTKQLQATLAAIMVMSTISVRAQLSTSTTTQKTSPNTTKTTVVTTDRSASKSKKRSTNRRATARKAPVESATARELRELREQMVNQQAQLDTMRQQMADKDKRIADATADASTANASAVQANQQAQTLAETIQASQTKIDTLSSDLGDLKLANSGLATTLVTTTRDLNEKIESPTTLHYKGLTITPVAFFALEGVYRTRSINSDINTPFNTTPFPGANQAHVSEFNLSGRQSRLGGLFEGNAGAYKLSGYFEADFLSAGATSNANQSNSYTFRQRQIWGQAATKSGFTVTGGQMWSLVTENGKSTDNRTEKLPNTVDSQYHVGYSWARQPGLRIQQKLGNPIFGSAVTVAMAVENAQDQSFTALNGPSNFFFAGPGQTGGLYNVAGNYANNVSPDVIAKAAFDFPHSHFEVGGIARFFRDRVYPLTPSTTTTVGGVTTTTYLAPGFNDTKFGGGAFGSARVTSKYVDVAAQGMFGDGTGRYGSSQLADLTVHPSGTLEPVRNYHGMFSLETHPSKKLDVYAYYGAEYAQRTLYRNAAGGLVGYGPITANDTGCKTFTATNVALGAGGVLGSPTAANCQSPTRLIEEGTIGFTYRFVSSPKYGRLQYQAVYSYLGRTSWAGVTSGTFGSPTATYGAPHATNNMIFTGMRYYIP